MSWRIEPSPRVDGIEEGLAARIHDPLWLLARQWQLGEFRGQDAGTPATAHLSGSTSTITAWRGAGARWTRFDPIERPIEAIIEPETRADPTLRERIEAGAQLAHLLGDRNLDRYAFDFVAAHAFSPQALGDPVFRGDALMAALAKRTADGAALHSTLTTMAAGGETSIAIDEGDRPAMKRVARDWLEWYAREIAPDSTSGTSVTWQEHRLEYAFALSSAAAGGTVLEASEYMGNGLDWFDFDIDTSAAADSSQASLPRVAAHAIPAPVRYGGMPISRFWTMEDAQYDFGSIDAAPNDLGRLLLVEFATVYSNDWFVVPVKLPTGTLTVLDHVFAVDVFGRALVLRRAGLEEPNWNLFSLETKKPGEEHGARQALFLPPTAGHVVQGEPVETVLFLRDEMANMAWAVEACVEDTLEARVDRRSRWIPPAPPAPADPATPLYRVQTVVPDYWIPLVPEQVDTEAIRLRLTPLADDDSTPIKPRGMLLTSTSRGRLSLFEEEVPREGVIVDRIYRHARWQGGRSAMWAARRKRTGKGEGSSGLRFDVLYPE